jgi:uncharacterized repeat protein (TIGR02543 family)
MHLQGRKIMKKLCSIIMSFIMVFSTLSQSMIKINAAEGLKKVGDLVIRIQTEDSTLTDAAIGTDYTYSEDGLLTIIGTNKYRISMNGTGPTTDRILVASNTQAVILDNVNIDVSGYSNTCAFQIKDGVKYTLLELVDGGTSTLKSGTNCAGIQKGTTGAYTPKELEYGKIGLTIKDESSSYNYEYVGSTLNATGGANAAGIGGGYDATKPYKSNLTDIHIYNCTVEATGGAGGAGIGGGRGGSLSGLLHIWGGSITAQGGHGGAGIGTGEGTESNHPTVGPLNFTIRNKVVATGGTGAAGIGGGIYGDVEQVYIEQGLHITAQGGNGDITHSGGAGIGCGSGGLLNNDIEIYGNTIQATGGDAGTGQTGGPGIGSNNSAESAKVIIEGGNVNAVGGGAAMKISPAPVNKTGTNVYLTKITLQNNLEKNGNPADKVKNAGLIDFLCTYNDLDYIYGIESIYTEFMTNSMNTDSMGSIYIYLPENTQTSFVSTGIFSGSSYEYGYTGLSYRQQDGKPLVTLNNDLAQATFVPYIDGNKKQHYIYHYISLNTVQGSVSRTYDDVTYGETKVTDVEAKPGDYYNFGSWLQSLSSSAVNDTTLHIDSSIYGHKPIAFACNFDDTRLDVTFQGNGGSTSNNETSLEQLFSYVSPYVTDTNLNQNTFVRPGYTFLGWNTEADGSGTGYTDNQYMKDYVGEVTKSTHKYVYMNLYAQWKQNYVPAPVVETKTVVQDGITDVPAALADNPELNSVDKIKEALRLSIRSINSQIDPENITFSDVRIMTSTNHSSQWEEGTMDNFPKEGIVIELPFPAGTNLDDYDFVLTQMIAAGDKAGTIENLSYTVTASGFHIRLMTPSTVAIGHSKKNSSETEISKDVSEVTEHASVNTGDQSNIAGWSILLIASMFVIGCGWKRKRKMN